MCIESNQLSRRAMLGSTAALGLTLPVTGMVHGMANQGSPPLMITNPDDALEALMNGNRRFIEGDMHDHDHEAAKKRGASGQSPFAAFIRCADSRVAPEIVFDQTIGELFVCGVAGNLPTPEIVASLEYAVAVLKTPLVVVMGHSNCGAVEAAIKYQDTIMELPGQLPGLVSELLPAAINTNGAEDQLAKAVQLNVEYGVGRIPRDSTVISEAVDAGRCRVVGGVYDLASGSFTLAD